MHKNLGFPHPIKKQRLMEIVRGSSASVEDVVTLMKFGEKLGKIPIVTKSPVGRKMFSCTIMEAFKLIDEGKLAFEILLHMNENVYKFIRTPL